MRITSSTAENFSEIYPSIHENLITYGDNVPSRLGDTKEFLNYKTEITQPWKRCVMGYNRDINIYFLLAEALWIWAGRRDSEFLSIFNSRMKEYSDDGKYFHAPYGWRLRNWGSPSINKESPYNDMEHENGIDQIEKAISMLTKNPADRRVVLSIWNPEFDLETESLDLPCNDLVMLKIRENKLHTTIANRSNDLNWGLTTNVFQFSMISNFIAACLGITQGSQAHLSQSLHAYLNNEATQNMIREIQIEKKRVGTSKWGYNTGLQGLQFHFNFSNSSSVERLQELDFHVKSIIHYLLKSHREGPGDPQDKEKNVYIVKLREFSQDLYFVYELLGSYVRYKREKSLIDSFTLIGTIIASLHRTDLDISALALNFFLQRLHKRDRAGYENSMRWLYERNIFHILFYSGIGNL